jgi:hypothetical protein
MKPRFLETGPGHRQLRSDSGLDHRSAIGVGLRKGLGWGQRLMIEVA